MYHNSIWLTTVYKWPKNSEKYWLRTVVKTLFQNWPHAVCMATLYINSGWYWYTNTRKWYLTVGHYWFMSWVLFVWLWQSSLLPVPIRGLHVSVWLGEYTLCDGVGVSWRPGDRLNIEMLSYRCRDSNVKDKTVSPTVLSLTWESPYLGKTVFIMRRGCIS